MIRTFLAAALLCVVCSSAYACDAMRPCYGNGKPIYDSAVAQDSFSGRHTVGHRAAYRTHRRVPDGLYRVMAEGAGRAVNWIKPRAWCGWWMRRHLGVANPAGNLARWWAHYGSAAHGPAVGTIVVWARGRRSGHVGIITGRTASGQWIVKSGNDGHRVRERPRSVAGAIAFRWPA